MSQTTMIAMLEEAEDVLRRAGCDVTADKVRDVLQAQQAEPVRKREPIDFPTAFLTTESGGGKYKLVLSFASLPDLHKGHDRILSAIKHCQQPAGAVPKAPTWYKRSDIVKALERMNYHTAIADELADWFLRHMQLAFNRGFYQAHSPAAATQREELELWHLLERATGELTRRAAPHVWEQIAWTAGAEFIEQRRARLAAAQKGGAA